jgi:hypothetical protein
MFSLNDITASYAPRETVVRLLISGVDSKQGPHAGTFDMPMQMARNLHRDLGIALHHGDCQRRGLLPVNERTG